MRAELIVRKEDRMAWCSPDPVEHQLGCLLLVEAIGQEYVTRLWRGCQDGCVWLFYKGSSSLNAHISNMSCFPH